MKKSLSYLLLTNNLTLDETSPVRLTTDTGTSTFSLLVTYGDQVFKRK